MILSSISKRFLFLFLVSISILGYSVDPERSIGNREGLPNLSTESDNQVKFFADALFWHASEETSSIWAIHGSSTFDPLITDVWEAKNITFDFDWGWRVGAGYVLPHDQWDTQLSWSWFRTDADSNVSGPTGLILPQFFGAFANGDHPMNGKLKWKILYNMCDWELGRSYSISQRLALRPFIGLKGGWIDQTLDSNWKVEERDVNGTVFPVDYIATENLKNNFSGIGPNGGIQTTWTLVSFSEHTLKFFGDLSSALMWGTWSIKDVYQNDSPYRISTNVKDLNLGSLTIRGFLGLGWEKSNETTHIAAKLGYESQLWVNQVRFPTFQQVLLHGNLTLQGGTLHVQIDF